MSESEYLAWDLAHPEKHEYVDGEVVAMAGEDPAHTFLAGRLVAALGTRLRGRRCSVHASDLRVRIAETGLYAYPDLVVICGAPEYADTRPRSLLNPRVIVEILSETTQDYDRGAKFAHYQRRASVLEYVLVSCPERRVEHYRRLDTGQWLLTVVEGDAEVPFPCLECAVPLSELYEGIEEHVSPSRSPALPR